MPESPVGISVLVSTDSTWARLVSGASSSSSELYVCPGGVALAAAAAARSCWREALVPALVAFRPGGVFWGDEAGVSDALPALLFFLGGPTARIAHLCAVRSQAPHMFTHTWGIRGICLSRRWASACL